MEKIYFFYQKNIKNLVIGIEPFKNGLANTAYYCSTTKNQKRILFPFVFQKFEKKFKTTVLINVIFFFQIHAPKKRHHKRRLVNYQFLKLLISHCNSKGTIYFGSDNYDYFNDVKNKSKSLKKELKISVKSYKKTPTIITRYHARAEN